ncbi:MAG: ABC transporter permease [Bosea sp. (in: a-proteobacteria)]
MSDAPSLKSPNDIALPARITSGLAGLWRNWPLLIACLLVLLPVLAVMLVAISAGGGSVWPDLLRYTLPNAVWNTLLLLAGVGILTSVIGVGTAWLVSQHNFPGRNLLDWMLVLPLALPTYITAYVYVEYLSFQGPFQSLLRATFGFKSLRDYWFPDVRSTAGAIFVMGLVLYPYVYLTTRALFAMQSACIIESARTLGANRKRQFWSIALPMARPAMAAGLTLALLEALNDIGATSYLGVQTLTLSIYTTWLSRGSLAGAAQIACVLMLLVAALIAFEACARRQQRYTLSVRKPRIASRAPLAGRAAWAATAICALPVLLGFVLPAGWLLVDLVQRGSTLLTLELAKQLATTLALAGGGTALAMALGLGVMLCVRFGRERWLSSAKSIASLGYALPGTVLALGLVLPLALLDNAISSLWQSLTGRPAGLILIGSGAAVVLAYGIRFLSIAIGGYESGLSRVSTRVDDAARALGASQRELSRVIHWPLARRAIAAGGLLVFIDCMKELPATLLLRPLNVETLATVVYGHASRGSFEDGAAAALLIVLAGLYPVYRMARAGDDPR